MADRRNIVALIGGGGASLEATRLYQQFSVSGIYTGEILPHACPFVDSLCGKPYPRRLSENSAMCPLFK